MYSQFTVWKFLPLPSSPSGANIDINFDENSRTTITGHTEARHVISCLDNYAGYSSYADAVSLRAWASSGHGLVYLMSQLQLAVASSTHMHSTPKTLS